MKKYFAIGLVFVLALSLSTIFYGVWLNNRSEYQIMQRMSENILEVPGARAEITEFQPVFSLSSVNLSTTNMADAVALIEGRITSNPAPKWTDVKRGDVLFTVENEDIALSIKEAQAQVLSAQAELTRATNTFLRHKTLKEQDATSLTQYDEAQSAYTAAVANLSVANAKLDKLIVQKSRQDVISPMDGKVLMTYRTVGGYVQAGTPMALVGSFDNFILTTPMEDIKARHLALGLTAELSFDGKDIKKIYRSGYAAGNLGSEQTFGAQVMQIRPPLSEKAIMRNVVWQVDNSSGLLEPQTYGAAKMRLSKSVSALTVPLSALIDGADTQVFVVSQEDGKISKRNLKVGMDDGNVAEVLEGLSQGEIVIIGGMEGLSEGMKVSVRLTEDSANGK